MDYSKYENKVEYPTSEIIKSYKDELVDEIMGKTAIGKEIQEMLLKVDEEVKNYKLKLEKKYAKEQYNIYMQFREDALEEAGLSHLPEEIQGRIFAKAWGKGHSFGNSEVFNYLLEYSELFEGYTMTKIE